MLSEQLNLFGDRPQAPKPPAQIRQQIVAKDSSDNKAEIVEKALAAVIMPMPEEPEISNEFNAPELAHQTALEEAEESTAETIIPGTEDVTELAIEESTGMEAGAELQDVAGESFDEVMEHEEDEIALESTIINLEHIEEEEDLAEELLATEALPESDVMQAAAIPAKEDIEEPIDAKSGELNIPPDHELFQRQYYTMRETTAMFGLTHAQLRSWENEFNVLQPRKNRKGDRYFRPVDIKNLELIYHLLRKRKFTPDGAKAYLKNNKNALDNFALIQKMEGLKSFLIELKANL